MRVHSLVHSPFYSAVGTARRMRNQVIRGRRAPADTGCCGVGRKRIKESREIKLTFWQRVDLIRSFSRWISSGDCELFCNSCGYKDVRGILLRSYVEKMLLLWLITTACKLSC